METTKKSNFSCDTETGICSLNEHALQDKNELHINTMASKPKLIYYYDALCGWCYGFSPVITKLYETYKDRIDIEVISGGLFLGQRRGYINNVAPYIKEGAYKNVEFTTGVNFGEGFLSKIFGDGNILLDSLPPSIALSIIKEKFPERQLEFGEMLLKAIYFDGLSADDINGFAKCASRMGYNKEEFITKMGDVKYKKMAEKEFKVFNTVQFSGMPTLVLENKGHQVLLSNGYASFKNLRLRLENLMNKC